MTNRRTHPGLVGFLGLTMLAAAGLPSHAAAKDEANFNAKDAAAQKDPTILAPVAALGHDDIATSGKPQFPPDPSASIPRHRQSPDEASLVVQALHRMPEGTCPLLRDTRAGAHRAGQTEARPARSGAPAPGCDASPAARSFATLRPGSTAPRIANAATAWCNGHLLPCEGGAHPHQPTATPFPAAYTAQGDDAVTLAEWRDTSHLPIATATSTSHTWLIPLGAALLLAASLAASLARAVQRALSRRALAPLAEIRTRLAKLAAEDFRPHEPAHTTRGDIAEMHSALDQLSLDGRRRLAMQAELARLGDRVVAANRQMTAELEAAARVQRAQLPAAPCGFRGGTFHAFFRPSRVVAGDTYDCLSLPDGRTRIFQIDVSGHGAPAALVSIASHIALKQAMLSAPPGEALADIIARTNRDWAEDLPYFTLLAVEIDPATATASIVQCGHPALLRLPAAGGVEALGDGGLPIGVLPDASFSTLTCPFHPGDRLVLVTDGVTETADPDAQMFGDDRLRALLAPARKGSAQPVPVPRLFDRIERALWDWRGSESLEDDITILVLEAT